jgi:cyanophycin synthetase
MHTLRTDKNTHILLIQNKKKYFFDINPIYLLNRTQNHYKKNPDQYNNKYYLKKILMRNNLPYSKGKIFFSVKKGFQYGMELGFPLVVKPVVGSLSSHTFINIKTHTELMNAIKLVKQVHSKILIEEFIPGDVYRSIIIDKEFVACAKREPANITGDEISTIEMLIDKRNADPRRGHENLTHYTLRQLDKHSQIVSSHLKKMNLSLNTILSTNQKIILSDKVNLVNGSDITNVTEIMHCDNKKLLQKVHITLNLPFSGFDFICEDITIPWYSQRFAIIENNSYPYIDMHHYPSKGDSINVAAKIWDFVIAKFIIIDLHKL